MKKWYQYWTVWAAIAALAGCWLPVWSLGDQASDVVLGAIVYALALVAIVFFVAFVLQYNRAKKAAREAAEAAHAAALRAAWAKKQEAEAAAAAAREAEAAKRAAERAAARAKYIAERETAAAKQEETPRPEAATSEKMQPTFERHKVSGVKYRLGNLMELAEENPDYDMSTREIVDSQMDSERIYQYTFPDRPVELIDDPGNEHDPNAIKVVVAGEHIGYIKRGSTGRIRNLRSSGRINNIRADIYGGRYKVVLCSEEYGEQTSELACDERDYGAVIEICVMPDASPDNQQG